MGNGNTKYKSPRNLTYTDLLKEMEHTLSKLTKQDRNLFDFAVTAVTSESKKMELVSVRICINFVDTCPMCIKSEDNPKDSFVISYDGKGGFFGDWETESVKRYAFRVLSTGFADFFKWLGKLVKAMVPVLSGAITKAITR